MSIKSGKMYKTKDADPIPCLVSKEIERGVGTPLVSVLLFGEGVGIQLIRLPKFASLDAAPQDAGWFFVPDEGEG